MRSNATRTIQEDSLKPACGPSGHKEVNMAEFDTAYKAWLKRRGLKETPRWKHNMFGKDKRCT